MAPPTKQTGNPSTLLAELRVAVESYASALRQLIETGAGGVGSVRAAARSVIRANKKAEAALVSFRLDVHDSWFDRMRRECEARADDMKACKDVATDKSRPLAELQCAAIIMTVVGLLTILPGALYSRVKTELDSALFELPETLRSFRHRERRATFWAVGCTIAALFSTIPGPGKWWSIAAAIVGLVAFLVEKLHLPDFTYVGSTMPAGVADEISAALDRTERGMEALQEMSARLLQIAPPAVPRVLIDVVKDLERGNTPPADVMASAMGQADVLHRELDALIRRVLGHSHAKQDSPSDETDGPAGADG